MSLDYSTIKIEPDNDFPVRNDDITDDSLYPKQALDLSKKNLKASENKTDNQYTFEMRPEFVNIKMEMDTIIKQEPSSDSEDTQPLSWHQPVTDTRETIKTNNLRTFEIQIKKEPYESDNQCDSNKFSQHTAPPHLIERIIQPNTSRDKKVSVEPLCQNATTDGKYMCPVCHNRFATKGLVQRHQLLHSSEKLQCTICSRSFVKAGHLKKHILSHSEVKSYDCPECGKQFKTTSNLEQHKKTHLAVKPFKCEICLKQFAVKANLIKHQRKTRCKRPIDQPITCHVCNKTFKKEFLLRSHLRRHMTEKPFTCELCDLSFKYKSTLIRHIQLHNGIKPYSCKICQKKFTHAGLIKPHMRKHTGEKPYPCPVCNKLFAHKHNMERHSLRHNKIKHLDCDVCHKRFPKESRLIYHMRIHTNDKPFHCEHCPKKFSHRQNVIRHYTRKHPGNVYGCQKTDASVARDVWESVIQKKGMKIEIEFEPLESCESNDEYVIP